MNYYAKLAEEKRNSTVARGTVHGHKYEVDRMSDGSYMGYVYDEEDFPIFKTGLHSTSSGAEQEIKSKVFNSKENSMNYYEKIIQEKHNSAESHLKRLIGKRFKRDTDLERAVNGSIYTEISDWSHPRMIVFDKYSDEKFYVTTEDNHQYGKDQEFWISRVEKANSKEEKENAYAKLVKKLSDFDIYEDAEGYFMRVKDGKVIKGGYLSIRDAETDGHRAKSASKDNARYTTLKLIRTEKYKGCEINVSESKSPYEDSPVYVYNAHDRQMKIFVSGIAGSEAEAITKAKREIDIKANSKEEGYYAKLAEEKKNK